MHAQMDAPVIGARETGTQRDRAPERIRIEQHSAAGLFWLIGWLFTIGFLHLPFWKAVLGIVAWPYYLGASLGPLLS